MKASSAIRRFVGVALIPAAAAFLAIGTAQAQYHDDHHDNHGQQQQNRGNDFHFQDQHRDALQSHYSKDINRWQNNQHRQHFERGQRVPTNVHFQAVPSSYYRGAPPPPAGYRYGYSNGYVVAYNPTTRIVADVLDLVTGH